ncbi:hypothetical protein ACFFOM_10055 [Microlunatus capsulatus]|uniref:IrrE N-terminal-like domain-containing protein n=1 Tax=Microlunatus capsulatus TaxID=99117 RepID=A0ABS4ZA47_9ACTN|nr:hypothetical protein [Microlunatus capsulatus]MBP2417922.1 hypothetical protein [Microlunatus capsulatus]
MDDLHDFEYLSRRWDPYLIEGRVNWQEKSDFLQRIAYGDDEFDQPAILERTQIALFLRRRWGLPVVLTSPEGLQSSTTALHGEQNEALQLGRFSIRRFSGFQRGDGYLVVDKNHYRRSGLWILLHELGHVAHHASTFTEASDIYRALARNPAATGEFGRSLIGKFSSPVMEDDADRFAAHWLLRGRVAGWRPDSHLDALGWAVARLSIAFDGCYPDASTKAKAVVLNREGAQLQQMISGGSGPLGQAPDRRAAHAVFEAAGLLQEPTSPQRLAESSLTSVGSLQSPLRTIYPDELGSLDWRREWDPILVRSPGARVRYYVAIAPRAALSNPSDDTTCLWRSVYRMDRINGRDRPLESWLRQHRESPHAGLMLFFRTPAERLIDTNQVTLGDEYE